MAERDERLKMPDGSVYIVRRTTAETEGEVIEMEFELPDRCVSPPPHVHPSQTEAYEVIAGTLEVMVGGEWSRLGPGESAEVPVGALHTFRNRSGATTRVRNWHRPALRFEEFIEDTCTTLRDAGVSSKRDPRLVMLLSSVMADYPETLTSGRARERIPMSLMARVGRRMRARAR